MNATHRPAAVLGCLRAAVGTAADGPADAALLARFARDRDEAAFELLVWRHAAMVLAVCRAVLRDHHAAEDACQATFLALARKAHAVGARGTTAGWLYRVARRTATRAARRRAVRPADVPFDALPAPAAEGGADADATAALHAELDRLPEKYRTPVLLCFLDGLTYADAARRLGWPVGTVAGRVARAKDWLRDRLAGRGVAVPAAGVAALVGTVPAVAPAFAAATARAGVAFAAGGGAVPGVSEPVLELAREAVRAMTVTKVQWAAGVLVACAALATGGVWAGGQQPTRPAGQQPAAVGQPRGGAVPAAEQPPAGERKATASQRRQSLNNLKQIMLAVHNSHDVSNQLPGDIRDAGGKALLSWRVAILPYIEQTPLYNQFKLTEPWDSEHNLKLLPQMPATYRLPGAPAGTTSTYYQVFAGPGTPLGRPRPGRVVEITDGTSNTLGVVEGAPAVPWTKPADLPYNPKGPAPKLTGPFSNGVHVAAMDGAAYALKRNIDADLLRNLIEAADGSVVPSLGTLTAPLPAETPEEKAALRQQIARNQKKLAEVEQLVREHVELLGGAIRSATDGGTADEQAEGLERIIEELRSRNSALRSGKGGMGGGGGAIPSQPPPPQSKAAPPATPPSK